MLLKVLMIGHLLGDFYFQSEALVDKKKSSYRKLIRHCMIYFMSLFIPAVAVIESEDTIRLFMGVLIISLAHWIIDYIKIKMELGFSLGKEKSNIVFLVDQLLHVALLYGFILLTGMNVSNDSFLCKVFGYLAIVGGITPVLAALICWKPASIFIVRVFETIPETNTLAEQIADCVGDKHPYHVQPKEGAKIGSWIGILEREIILMLGIMGQFGAIGFVLAAKSLARYKQLESKAFAERYLVGTLLSAVIAILCVAMCS